MSVCIQSLQLSDDMICIYLNYLYSLACHILVLRPPPSLKIWEGLGMRLSMPCHAENQTEGPHDMLNK